MKKNKFLLTLILFAIFLSSCAKPAEGTKEIKITYFFKWCLDSLNDFRNNPDGQLDFFDKFISDFNAVIAYEKGTKIFLNSKNAEFDNNTFAYTLENNRLLVCKDMYITYENNRLVYSFDNKIWYSNENEKNKTKKKTEGISKKYFFNSEILDDNIYIDYYLAFGQGRASKIIELSNDKKVITISKGKVFMSKGNNNIYNDLNDNIMFIPSGTIMDCRLNINGNIINTQIVNNKICLKSIIDIFIYKGKNTFSISFDKQKWGVNIFSFEIIPKYEISATENNNLLYDINIIVNYHKDKKSFSIIKFLLGFMK